MMILTGLAHPPTGLFESNPTPSIELISFARLALGQFSGATLLTSLEPGWDLALAKAAIEMEIPCRIALLHASPETDIYKNTQSIKRRFSQTIEIETVDLISDELCMWRIRQADQVVALWNYDFNGKTFEKIASALSLDKPVCNLWREWEKWVHMRRNRPTSMVPNRHGAQVFTKS
jgi:hypothetical protein